VGRGRRGGAHGVGRRRAGREDVLENCRTIAEATDLPVSADLENGYADVPEKVAGVIEAAWHCGAAGGSIEDGTWDRRAPVYDFSLAVERVAAASEAARAL